ncbi:hypothetical protein [Globicatella sulfidifaciens]|uniref:Uncharacterized protein n=1 Tax=Globicatella sulfidifaciens TaxID=136093 RepID=A0A7X8C5F0_9LACT|nr:hypothetical protein [Globicatella sulfidifaciens]NLJ19322.1 hypothetical protein [Globicatella sulfidifaciens]
MSKDRIIRVENEESLKEIFTYLNFIEVTDEWTLYKSLNLHNDVTDVEFSFKNETEALNHKIDGKTVKELLSDYTLTLMAD